MTAVGLLGKGPGAELDFLRDAVSRPMEEETKALVGADCHESSEEHTAYPNGVRHRQWDTREGTLHSGIPKLCSGSHFLGWLEPGRRSQQALVTVVAGAHLQGVSTRRSGGMSRA